MNAQYKFCSTEWIASAALAVNIGPDLEEPGLPRDWLRVDGSLARSPLHNVPNKSRDYLTRGVVRD